MAFGMTSSCNFVNTRGAQYPNIRLEIFVLLYKYEYLYNCYHSAEYEYETNMRYSFNCYGLILPSPSFT